MMTTFTAPSARRAQYSATDSSACRAAHLSCVSLATVRSRWGRRFMISAHSDYALSLQEIHPAHSFLSIPDRPAPPTVSVPAPGAMSTAHSNGHGISHAVRHDVTCSSCLQRIVGTRYSCSQCSCELCEEVSRIERCIHDFAYPLVDYSASHAITATTLAINILQIIFCSKSRRLCQALPWNMHARALVMWRRRGTAGILLHKTYDPARYRRRCTMTLHNTPSARCLPSLHFSLRLGHILHLTQTIKSLQFHLHLHRYTTLTRARERL